MDPVEKKIAEKLIEVLGAQGLYLALRGVPLGAGESDYLGEVDDQILKVVRVVGFINDDPDDPRLQVVGWVRLIWGNGIDLISDCTVGVVEAAIEPMHAFCDTLA